MYLYWIVPTVGYRTRSTLFVVWETNVESKNTMYFVISIETETNLLEKPLRGNLLSISPDRRGATSPEHKTQKGLRGSRVKYYLTLIYWICLNCFALSVCMHCVAFACIGSCRRFRYSANKRDSVIIIIIKLGMLCILDVPVMIVMPSMEAWSAPHMVRYAPDLFSTVYWLRIMPLGSLVVLPHLLHIIIVPIYIETSIWVVHRRA